MKKFYEDNGCELISDKYITKKTKYKFICKCGDEWENTFDSFYNGKRQCKNCADKQRSESQKMVNAEQVKEYVRRLGGTFIELYRLDSSKGYTKPYVKYICAEGHENNSYYMSIKKGHGCKECSSLKARERYQKSLDEVRLELESYGLTLTSDKYFNMDLPI